MNYIINKVNFFLLNCLKNKEMSSLDVYFSKVFESKNNNSAIFMLFASIISLSNRLGHICLPIFKIFNLKLFNDNILNFLYYFFKDVSIKKCLNIMLKFNILSIPTSYIDTPFILYNDCVYLHKYWIYEDYVVNFLNKKNYKNIFLSKNDIFFIKKQIKKFFFDKYQILTILSVFINRISIISGEAGTGKTNLIVKLIIVLYSFFNYKNSNCVKIVTPTGKAASYITNTLQKIFNSLNLNDKFKSILPEKAITIHKLLGYNYFKNNIYYNYYLKLDINVLIIDESSMLDVLTMFNILSSLKEDTKIILVGDSFQIGSIECGSVFNEICNYFLYYKRKNSFYINKMYFFWKKNNFDVINKLNINCVSFLKKNYRFSKKKKLKKFSFYVRNSNFKEIDKFLQKKKSIQEFNFYDLKKKNFNFFLNFCTKRYWNFIYKINHNYNNLYFINKTFNKFQLICVLRNTYFGVNFLNKFINLYLLNKLIKKKKKIYKKKNNYYYFGEPILITKNNNELNLFNGDLGFIIPDKLDNFKIGFLKKKNKYKIVNFYNLPEWEYSWAITVHKSQGSEFGHVLLILPNYFNDLLNKELIYTAITRAKFKLTIFAVKEVFLYAIKNNNLKFNNLKNRFIF